MASAVYPDQKPGLNSQTIEHLKKTCKENHFEKGRPAARIILIAAIAAAIFTFFALEGRFFQLPLSFGFFFAIGDLLSRVYHSLRNQTSIKVADALDKLDFQAYLATQKGDMTAEQITASYIAYQRTLKA